MATYQSVKSRSSLFFEAPICSGPPSYGGVLKSTYLITAIIFCISLAIVIPLIIFGILPYRTILGVPITAFVSFIGMLAVTRRRRRDYVAVVIAAWKFNKEERRVFSQKK